MTTPAPLGFKPNLSENILKVKEDITFPKLGSPKLDGIRSTNFYGMSYSRSMKVIPNKHVQEIFRAAEDLDGEFVVGNPAEEGCYNKTLSLVMSNEGTENLEDLRFFAFDSVRSTHKPFVERAAEANEIIDRLPTELAGRVEWLEQTIINTREQLDAFYLEKLDQGYEGAMLRNPFALYKCGRSTAKSQDLLKMKPEDNHEALILEVIEAQENQNEAFTNELGRTARSTAQGGKVGKNMIGGFRVRDIKTLQEFNIGPGKMLHKDRINLWPLRENLLGKLCIYRSMSYGALDAARQGRWYGWRDERDMSC